MKQEKNQSQNDYCRFIKNAKHQIAKLFYILDYSIFFFLDLEEKITVDSSIHDGHLSTCGDSEERRKKI